LIITRVKGSWSFTGTRLLAKVLVKTMVMTIIWILCLLRSHRLTPIIGKKWLGLCHIPRILGRVSLVDPMGIGVEPYPGFHWLWKGFPQLASLTRELNPAMDSKVLVRKEFLSFSPMQE
jgi:hypothetical protein